MAVRASVARSLSSSKSPALGVIGRHNGPGCVSAQNANVWLWPSGLISRVLISAFRTRRLASGFFSGPNIYLRLQGSMHGTLVSYFKKPGALFLVKIARQRDRAFDTIDHSILSFAISAICS